MTDNPSPPSAEEQCIEFIHEMLGMIKMHCEVAQTYCEMRDLVGLEYQLRRMVPTIKSAIETFKEAKALGDGEK